MRPAVFLDRDGTIIHQVHHISRPSQVELLPGVPDALRLLRRSGYACVVVTNQSAVGRGVISLDDVRLVQEEVDRQLTAAGTCLDGFYFCPIAPCSSDRAIIEHADRKPGPGMLRRAASDLKIDLSKSWMIGDMLSDLLAGKSAGCRGSILVRTGYGADADRETLAAADHICDDLSGAAGLIVEAQADPRSTSVPSRSPQVPGTSE